MIKLAHRRLWQFIAAIAGLFALLATAAFLLINELEQIDDQVVGLSESSAEHFLREHHDDILRAWERGRRQAIRQSVHEVLSDNFVIVEVYDLAARPIVEAVRPGYEEMERRLSSDRHGFPSTRASAYKKFLSDGRLYLQVISPLTGREGQTIGFFEGVYELPEDQQQRLQSRLIMSVGVFGGGILLCLTLIALAVRKYRRTARIAQNQ